MLKGEPKPAQGRGKYAPRTRTEAISLLKASTADRDPLVHASDRRRDAESWSRPEQMQVAKGLLPAQPHLDGQGDGRDHGSLPAAEGHIAADDGTADGAR